MLLKTSKIILYKNSRDYGFLTDLNAIKKDNLPRISYPLKITKNKKMPVDNSQFFKCSTIKSNNFKDIPNSDFSKTMNGLGRSKININYFNRK